MIGVNIANQQLKCEYSCKFNLTNGGTGHSFVL
jgi:hypothetical protein